MKIEDKQDELLKILADIQENFVQIAMGKYKEGDDVEDLLYDTTFEIIANFMVFIDGYYNQSNLKIDLIDQETGVSLKTGIQLHDECTCFLKYKKE